MAWKLFAVLLILGLSSGDVPTKSKLSNTIKSLRDAVMGLQTVNDDKGTWFSKGFFPVYVTSNLFGSKEMVFLRHALKTPDNTYFATTIILEILLELSDIDLLTPTDVNNIASAIDTMHRFKDKNIDGEHSVLIYWEQVADEDGNWMSACPDGLSAEERVEFVNSLMSLLLKSGFAEGDIAKAMPYILMLKAGLTSVSTPPELDSQGLTLAFGSLLKKYSKLYPTLHKRWSFYHTNVTQSTVETFRKYAYRPLSEDKNVNTISTMSYFIMKDFIQSRREQGDRDIAISTIWRATREDFAKFGEHRQTLLNHHNEIDVTACSNVITSITYAVTTGLWDPALLDDAELQNVYLDTMSMVVYQVKNHFSGTNVHGLAHGIGHGLGYYASRYQVYWWITRIYSQLENIIKSGEALPHKVLYTVHSEVKDVLRTVVTQLILREGQSDNPDVIFYDDFASYLDPEDANPQTLSKLAREAQKRMFQTLSQDRYDHGQADQSFRDKEDKMETLLAQTLYNTIEDVNKYQRTKHGDRIFTTSLAANVLLSTWTYRDATSGKLVWDDATPCRVERLVERVVTWLDRHTLSGEYRPDGCMYTAGPLTEKFHPWRYPFNVNTYMNGTERHGVDDIVSFDGVLGVSGVIPEDEYDKMLKQMWEGDDWINTPRDFKDPDVALGMMLFTSEAYTYMTALSAMTKYAALL